MITLNGLIWQREDADRFANGEIVELVEAEYRDMAFPAAALAYPSAAGVFYYTDGRGFSLEIEEER